MTRTERPEEHKEAYLGHCRALGDKEAPYEVIKIPRRTKEIHPNLVQLRRYADGSVKGKFVGPGITDEEEKQLSKDRAARREKRLALALARKDIKEGKQKRLSAYFSAKGKA